MKSLIFFISLLMGIATSSFALETKFIEVAISLEDSSVRYDGSYRKIGYPLGDVPADVGVCSDVIIRAYRGIDIDLQQLVHEDMKKNFSVYPKIWGLSRTDRNIDHRRVLNLRAFFKRHGKSLSISDNPNDYKPGNLVTWNLKSNGSLPHIGIVTNLYSNNKKRPIIMHNMGRGQVLEDMLFDYKITGHYRYRVD
tara:strand:+ start:1027 stop:1611 length:585 start_codon:yes stop_codon:yes gene_type:complete